METRSELDELLEAFDRDRSYTTERLVKENELERTELVRDAARPLRPVRVQNRNAEGYDS